jgi:hypothetical protein
LRWTLRRRGIGGDLGRLHGLVLGGGQLCLGVGSLRLPSTECRRSILPGTFLGAGHTVTAATAIAAISFADKGRRRGGRDDG